MTSIHGYDLLLGFGLESEGVLAVKSAKFDELTALGYKEVYHHMSKAQRVDGHRTNATVVRKYLEREMTKAGLPAQIRGRSLNEKDYTVMWLAALQTLFTFITRAFDILDKDISATHVHVAPVGRRWSLTEIQSITKCLLAWTPHFRRVLPLEHGEFAAWQTSQLYDKTIDPSSMHDLVLHMVEDEQELEGPCNSSRYVAWNFLPLENDDPRSTIEFRRPCQSLCYNHAAHWVALTLGLFSIVLDDDDGYRSNSPPTTVLQRQRNQHPDVIPWSGADIENEIETGVEEKVMETQDVWMNMEDMCIPDNDVQIRALFDQLNQHLGNVFDDGVSTPGCASFLLKQCTAVETRAAECWTSVSDKFSLRRVRRFGAQRTSL
ncbi:hypothetical protein BDW02DRAFT_612999 [Decorospora gaudefroyi]|uniref:Uncharacterized protein n=1 Tax=Decorospora gaudefroyi TaxID=184978 RepID=A0A6A5JZG2_9PLEO|nr:hypothetical protein BDW02DRAFT_612999 [Decorospora gaudefroyi]